MFCRKRHVVNKVLNTYTLPTDEQKIVKLVRSCGNNLHEVVTPEGEKFLVTMPTKFRNYLWVGRGCFVVVDPIEEGGKVKGEIIQILLKEQIQHLMDEGVCWVAASEWLLDQDESLPIECHQYVGILYPQARSSVQLAISSNVETY
ncbi:probable RNA-binding protein EIF1AD [Trichonephila inaurata madagascariensis]|uniref:Probable RNA-binding protein EIF1AD n=1 Tax=Trichonephila inaurata madagascariensis TaxID=2747483 RepID=A0A8X6XH17_9ARAC|nr:probable RNA-binding protein EIF1AD [Trichonephila inaurata madagascariensis]